jgi:hypothetical protein
MERRFDTTRWGPRKNPAAKIPPAPRTPSRPPPSPRDASSNLTTPASLFPTSTSQGRCRSGDKLQCAGTDIGDDEAAIDFDSCDLAALSVQHTKADDASVTGPPAEPSKDQPIQRTFPESGDVATGTQVVPPSSAPSSRNPALHNSQHVQLLPPEHRRTAEQGTNTEPQIQIGPSYESIGLASDQGWPESPADQRRITPTKPVAPGRHLWEQLYNAHWGAGGPIPYWSPFYDDFGNVFWTHRDHETGHMTWRTSPPKTDHLRFSYDAKTGVIRHYPGPTPLHHQTEDASWYVETTPYHADVALTTIDPLTQPPRAKEVQFIVSEPQSWPQDEATVFAASSSPSSTHLGLMLHKDKRLRHSTAEKCTGIKPKESSLPRGPSKFKPSAAAKAAKKAAADYEQSHKAFYETRDTPPTAPDLYSPYHDEDEDNDDYDDDG